MRRSGNQSAAALRTAFAVVGLALSSPAAAQLRIVDYNIAQNYDIAADPAGLDTILAAIGGEVRNGVARPIDVLAMQELSETGADATAVAAILNGLYGVTSYAAAPVPANAFSGGNGLPGLVYNAASVTLLDAIALGDVGSGGAQQPRSSLRYHLRPVGYGPTADFYLFNDHYKSDDGSIDQQRRNAEAQSVRTSADALGDGAHVIYAGDFNVYHSDEPMYQKLLSAGPGQAFDPIDTPGSWSGSSFKLVHTQSPATQPAFTGQVLGGLNDRFDFQLVTGELLDGEGLSYLSGSYRVFGNNGTHAYSQAITTGSGAAPGVLAALASVSDHLPVVADYQLPARLSVQVAAVPPSVPLGSSATVSVVIQNGASASTSLGADELDYTLSVSGDLLGGGAGSLAALAPGVNHQITLNTAAAGARSGVITVTSASQGAATPLFTLPISFVVGGGGSLVRVTVAKDDFDAPLGRTGFSQTPAPGAYTSPASGFQVYQADVSGSIPFALVDQSADGFPADVQGVINTAAKSDAWFGVTDTVNNDNLNGGSGEATWAFDVSDATGLEVSIDMAAMGDFEATGVNADAFHWAYSMDGAPFQPLFISSVDGSSSALYTLADGDVTSLDDPLFMADAQGAAVQLNNVMQTLTTAIPSAGSQLTLRLTARSDGQGEAYAFDNITITGLRAIYAEADFDEDGAVDEADLAAWSTHFSTTGALKSQGDADADGDVDGADLLVWQRQRSDAPGISVATTVPEPSGLAALLAAMAALRTFARPAACKFQINNS
ncbi:MAG: hypothetical protein DCC67_17825 [Planctomycetota bacterium]|nr:MAG: hypothetical protein DCC67_17825 [Planctomycetota bacterium]